MRKGISHWSLPGGEARGVADALADARAAGFAVWEPAIGLAGALTVEATREACAAARSAAAAAGVALETVATGLTWRCSPTHIDPAVRQRAIELQCAALERAAWLGAQDFLIVPGAVTIPWDRSYPPVPYADALKWAAQGIAALLPTSQRLGVRLCVENVWNGLFASPIELGAFVDDFGGAVAVYLDVGNLMGLHQWPPHWIAWLGRRIARVHLKDFRCDPGGLQGFVPLGQGDVPWRETIAALRSIGYDGTLIAEVAAGTGEALQGVAKAMDDIVRGDFRF